MKKNRIVTWALSAALLLGTCTASAQFVGERGSDNLKIGVAGFTFRAFDADRTLEMLKRMGVKYVSVKEIGRAHV